MIIKFKIVYLFVYYIELSITNYMVIKNVASQNKWKSHGLLVN